MYDASNVTTASQHVDKLDDYFDRHEIDDEYVKIRLFAQSLGGEARKWFKGLTPNSINDLPSFHQLFLKKWEFKRKPLQILSEYNDLKIKSGESVQDYCTRFNSVYNALPPQMKPPQGLALMMFHEGFDLDMCYQLREREPLTL